MPLRKQCYFFALGILFLASQSVAENQVNEDSPKTLRCTQNIKIDLIIKSLSECFLSPQDSTQPIIKFFGERKENQQERDRAQKIMRSYIKDLLEKHKINIIERQGNCDTMLKVIYSDGCEITCVPGEKINCLLKPILHLRLMRKENVECAQTFETFIEPIASSPSSYERVKGWINECFDSFLNQNKSNNNTIEDDPFSNRQVAGVITGQNKSLEYEDVKIKMNINPGALFDIRSRQDPRTSPTTTKKIIYLANAPIGELVLENK